MNSDNKRETGMRAPNPSPVQNSDAFPDTGDRGDRPKKPYGLTRPINETDEKTRQSDGTSSEADRVPHQQADK